MRKKLSILLAAVMLTVLHLLGRRVERDRLRAACWLLILLLGGILSIFVPGAMIFFLLAWGRRALPQNVQPRAGGHDT